MIYKDLSVALLTFILRFLNGGHRRRRGADLVARRLLRAAHRHGRRHAKKRSKKDARPHLTLSASAGPVVILALILATLRHLLHRRSNRQCHVKTDGCALHRLRRNVSRSGCASPRPTSRSVRCGTAPSIDGGRVLLANRGLLQRMQTPSPPLFDRADCSFKSPLLRALVLGHG
ncbi:hypothetical protein ZEAMMB73_Zm00001d038360 [Zea mays]|uniref:Uncharacterized protein n=1 Tax=Zea mays TaxID=4577 RepID=A0A1D6M5Q4_MAIZE|nr:hypothetical protein ZEAMMB73_Zm00001d038360 [Zea mays]